MSILPLNGTSRAQLQLVEFKSFALSGQEARLGLFSYKEGGQHKEIKAGQIGQRVFKAQLLARSTGDAQLPDQPDSNATKPASRKSLRRPTKASQKAEAEMAGIEKRTAAEQAQRALKDKAHKQACIQLSEHPEWLQLSDETVEQKGMQFQSGKLAPDANCPSFGKRRYEMLTVGRGVSFARCEKCTKVFTSLSEGANHRCKPPDEPQAPLQRQRQPQEHLEGGVQLEPHLLHQVELSALLWMAHDRCMDSSWRVSGLHAYSTFGYSFDDQSLI